MQQIADKEFPQFTAGDEPITHQKQKTVVFYKIFESVVEGVVEGLEGDDQQALELEAIADLVITYCQARRYKRSLLITILNSVEGKCSEYVIKDSP